MNQQAQIAAKVQQAKIAGIQAFESGKGRAPALNSEFIKAAAGPDLVELLGAYLHGWDVANLAANAIPGAPSVRLYNEIMGVA
jgi:hypothetical protein